MADIALSLHLATNTHIWQTLPYHHTWRALRDKRPYMADIALSLHLVGPERQTPIYGRHCLIITPGGPLLTNTHIRQTLPYHHTWRALRDKHPYKADIALSSHLETNTHIWQTLPYHYTWRALTDKHPYKADIALSSHLAGTERQTPI